MRYSKPEREARTDRWRDVQNVEHVMGKCIISDRRAVRARPDTPRVVSRGRWGVVPFFRTVWLKNRDPQHWRDSQQMEHVLGKYIISDNPMTEEQRARERADVIDDEPQFGDGREGIQLEHANTLLAGASPLLPRKE
jgi:hypothetical protein